MYSTPNSLHPNPKTDVFGLIFRIISLSFIGIIAIWANHEVSKGFSITIVNDASKNSLAGKRFSLFYESNDKATRLVLNSSRFLENLLFPNQNFQKNEKKRVNSVTLRLAPITFPSIISVDSPKPYEYLIDLSPSLMESSSHDEAVRLAIFQAMARVWLWADEKTVQPMLLDGMVEYITDLAGFTQAEVFDYTMIMSEKIEICWKDKDPRKVAGFLRYVDGGGFGDVIRRLNDGMRNGWHDRMVDDAFGMEGQHACAMLMRADQRRIQLKNLSVAHEI